MFRELELPCVDCPAAEVETLEFGFCLMEQPQAKLDTLIERLNALPPPPPGEDEEDDGGPVGPITALIGWLARRRSGDSARAEGADPPKR